MDILAFAIQTLAVLLTLGGMAYGIIALWAARDFRRSGVAHSSRLHAMSGVEAPQPFTPPVSILKPMAGADDRTYAGLVSHCTQLYAGAYEIVFGVRSLDDPAVAQINQLRTEFPQIHITLVECPERLGTNGKLSNLTQMLPHAQYEHIVVNDADIRVSPHYLARIVRPFQSERTGLVTAPYIGRSEQGLWSRLEALGISTDFMPGVLTARTLEGGIRFGLGSTLATTQSAIKKIGGFAALVEQLADDYELGARLAQAGYTVELAHEVVETTVPAYTLRGFCEHQLRWSRSTRDSRRLGYLGLGVTYILPWALLAVLASGGSLWSLTLLSLALLTRVAVALTVGVGILRDGQVLRDILLLPLRDAFGLFFWAWSYAGDIVVWRGEQFRLKRGVMTKL